MTHFNKNPDRKELRNFGLITGTMTAGVFGLALPLLFAHPFPKWPWLVAALLMAWAFAAPKTLKPVYLVWMTVGQMLGWLNTRIIMSVMFYLLIMPAGLIMRLSGKDPMTRSMSAEENSYRVPSTAQEKNHVEKPF